jgi:hypothetical protein
MALLCTALEVVLTWRRPDAMRLITCPGMLFIGSVIAMPLGDDDDDFPAGAFLEELEDDCLACGAATELVRPEAKLIQKKGAAD